MAGATAFTLFSELPVELRLQIWDHSLRQRRRLLRVQPRDGTLFVEGHGVHSKLLRVNAESRQAALDFYNVAIPCKFYKCGEERDPSSPPADTLYFSPHHDYLYFSPDLTFTPAHDMANVLYAIKTIHDPHRVGVLNLALDRHQADDLLQCVEMTTKSPDLKPKLETTISQLENVIFVCTTSSGRMMHPVTTLGPPTFNRSFPIMARTASFELHDQDPRVGIDRDLRRILWQAFMPEETIKSWRRLLKQDEVTLVPIHATYQILLSSTPETEHELIRDAQGADTWLQREGAIWTEWNESFPGWEPPPDPEPEAREPGHFLGGDSNPSTVQTAFGFWLFPLTVLKSFPEESGWTQCFMLDLTDYWPALGLFSIR